VLEPYRRQSRQKPLRLLPSTLNLLAIHPHRGARLPRLDPCIWSRAQVDEYIPHGVTPDILSGETERRERKRELRHMLGRVNLCRRRATVTGVTIRSENASSNLPGYQQLRGSSNCRFRKTLLFVCPIISLKSYPSKFTIHLASVRSHASIPSRIFHSTWSTWIFFCVAQTGSCWLKT